MTIFRKIIFRVILKNSEIHSSYHFWVDLEIQMQSRSISDPPLSDIDLKNKMTWVWTSLKFVPPKLPLCAFRGIGILLIFSCDDCPTGFYWYFSRGLSLGRRVEFEKKKGLSVSLIHLVTSVIGYENLLWYFILINMTNQ